MGRGMESHQEPCQTTPPNHKQASYPEGRQTLQSHQCETRCCPAGETSLGTLFVKPIPLSLWPRRFLLLRVRQPNDRNRPALFAPVPQIRNATCETCHKGGNRRNVDREAAGISRVG